MRPAAPDYLRGTLFGLAAVSIWASWSVVTRLTVATSLDPCDITALRFGLAGVLLLPVVMRRGLAADWLGWAGLAVLIAGQGAPYVLVAAEGLRFAPARDGGALNPGCMPLFVALIASLALAERLSAMRKLGLALMLAGALAIVGSNAANWSASRLFGDALFLCAAFLSACFTVDMRQSKLDPLHTAALVATASLAIYLPIYLTWHGVRLDQMPLADLVTQALFQGVLVTIIGVILYGRAVALLGTSAGAAFGALVPALAALFAIVLLREWPNKADWLAILLISAGVYLASGGPLPRRGGSAWDTISTILRH
jgi:drug/metabolite transporter (DMT)-like permease